MLRNQHKSFVVGNDLMMCTAFVVTVIIAQHPSTPTAHYYYCGGRIRLCVYLSWLPAAVKVMAAVKDTLPAEARCFWAAVDRAPVVLIILARGAPTAVLGNKHAPPCSSISSAFQPNIHDRTAAMTKVGSLHDDCLRRTRFLGFLPSRPLSRALIVSGAI